MPRAKKPAKLTPPSTDEYVTIAEQDVVVLQLAAEHRMTDLQDIVMATLGTSRLRRPGTIWLAFSGSRHLHVNGLSEWIGLSRNVPVPVVDSLQDIFEAVGTDVQREMGRALYCRLTPFARVSDDGLELLVPAALVGARGRVVQRGSTKPVVRGYLLART